MTSGARPLTLYEEEFSPNRYGKIKVGVKTLDDAVLNLGSLAGNRKNRFDKGTIIRALGDKDLPLLRAISDYYFNVSGIYKNVCNYYANLYRYDWYIVPEVYDESYKNDKILEDFNRILTYLDNSHIKSLCGKIALKVIKYGAYYGYIVPGGEGLILQELPVDYCRSRFNIGDMPAVEFNMAFFDDKFPDVATRMKVLKMFPAEFAKGYTLYKQSKLGYDKDLHLGQEKWMHPYGSGETRLWSREGWYLLDPASTIKFNFNDSDMPVFVNAIPTILDLDAAQDLDRRKQMQKLLKIIVQKLPLDKNGDLIFDVDEAEDIHNNAVAMLSKAVGVDVLTTFADILSFDMSDKNTTASQDDLAKVERSVFNALGLSKNIFNTDGNLSLEKSILEDESTVRNLLLQFAVFFDKICAAKNTKKKKYYFRLYMLETTQYNYKELSKLYKEQVQIGYSKMLPQIALGHSQSSILNTCYFENEILDLPSIMIPPLMSSTMSGQDILGRGNKSNTSNQQNNTGGNSTQQTTTKVVQTSEKSAGRPEKADDQKSDKTIANRESMS